MLFDTARRATKNLRGTSAQRRARFLRLMPCALIVAGAFSPVCRPARAALPTGDEASLWFRVETTVLAHITEPVNAVTAADTVVINEINYNSHDDYESKDWVELYNAGTTDVDLTGWTYSDEKDDPAFSFPNGTILKSGEYLVATQEIASFSTIHPGVSNVVGDVPFGLAGGGELVRIFDASGAIADSLTYDDKEPWPEEADGDGYTLALADPTCDNHLPECWSASAQMNGTPGAANFPGVTATERETPETPLRIDIYPNPSDGQATVSVSGMTGDAVQIEVFDVRGRQVPVPASRISLPGKAVLNMGELAAGLYFVRIASSHGTVHRAMMVGW